MTLPQMTAERARLHRRLTVLRSLLSAARCAIAAHGINVQRAYDQETLEARCEHIATYLEHWDGIIAARQRAKQ